ncbi:hypothetical protein [Paeniglutamicibacter cryotolerans]|uniref:Uncharacterized protein n=1 Tax=Paeniglutamicibacter cryotolerans TaxID=670079 RepID=A0A839QK43_9MICC|nr:hypothetical protein [Paeniglutamicibacter cryotolerans]MBB2995124.1 hypothetical protein [Paeniglutamicibacter cryotolerans]
MSEQNTQTTVGHRRVLAFETAGTWIPEILREEVELFAAMPPAENEFTPNIVVTVNAYAGTLQDFSRLALAGLESSLSETRIVDVGSWAYRFQNPDAGGNVPTDALGEPLASHEGRAIEYTHRAPNGRTVSGVDYLVLLSGWAIQISTTTAIQTRFIFDGDFERMARSTVALRAAGPADAADHVPAPAMHGIDPIATDVLGEEAEDLSLQLTSGADVGAGNWISGEALARIPELQDAVVGRLGAMTADPVLDELRGLGLMENGRLGGVGQFMAAALSDASARLRLTGRFLDHESLFQAFAYGDQALVIAGPGYGPLILNQAWDSPAQGALKVQILPLSELTSSVSRWAGAGPAWNLHVAPFMFEQELIEERFGGEAPLPEGAGQVLEQVWNQPWFIWQLEVEGPRGAVPACTYVNAGPRGNYRIGTVEEPGSGDVKTAMWATESALIFRQVEDALQAAYFGRDARLA